MRAHPGNDEQKYYRYLRNYGQTLEQTKYAKGRTGVATSSIADVLQKSQTSKLEQWQHKKNNLHPMTKQHLESAKHEMQPAVSVRFQRHADLIVDVDNFLKTCTDAASSSAYLAASVYKLQESCSAWEAACKNGTNGVRANLCYDEFRLETLDAAAVANLSYVKSIWAAVQDLLNGGHLHARTGDVLEAIELSLKAMEDLGFHGTSTRLGYCLAMHTSGNLDPVAAMVGHMMRRVTGASVLPQTTGQGVLAAGMTEACFQLRHLGHLLPRELPRTADPRATSFNPDMWQRQVLDAIDDRASCVVCAPTSSGKTFISSYCMETVLQDPTCKDGKVVVVCPTKALVNQTSAQV